jgi:hypothetical protein
MKHFFSFLTALLLTATTFAQVGINTETPDPSSALDITSTDGGLLPPRMTSDQRDNIVSPVEGLIIFCTDCGSGEGELQIKLSSEWGNLYNPGTESSTGNLYLARVEYTSTQVVGGVEFIDPSGNGDFLTAGANVGTISNYNNVEFTFTNELTPPKEIIAYGYQANMSRYVITQLDGGGNNAQFYAQGANESAHSSSFGIGNQVTTDIMTNFSSAQLKLELSMAYLDAVRNAGGFGTETKEAHAFIIFRF